MTTAKPSAPVVGFNHNVKYGERVYHVQTEDSGLPHAHYITHLFVGGNIISSIKTSYADRAEQPELAKTVRSLMESQHKQMLKRLVSGEFQELAAKFSAQHYEPGVLADGTNTASYVNTTPSDPALHPVARPPPPARVAPPVPPKPPEPAIRRPPPQLTPKPPAQVITPAPPRTPGQPLPPVTRGPVPAAKPLAPPRMVQVVTPKPPAAAKPSVFSDGPVEMPHEDLPTLFAEELISEKSLDEVILAFLSADLDPPK
ncbi:MAG TPA: hypothetical protein VH083_27900 [Myxococcales bacterium]|nr:hypothetical protein [Myxococcales bacterium]